MREFSRPNRETNETVVPVGDLEYLTREIGYSDAAREALEAAEGYDGTSFFDEQEDPDSIDPQKIIEAVEVFESPESFEDFKNQ